MEQLNTKMEYSTSEIEETELQYSRRKAYLADMHGDTAGTECMLFDRRDNGLLPKSEITAIKSEAKSGKTWLCQLMAAAVLGNKDYAWRAEPEREKPVVLWYDTEQSEQTCNLMAFRLARLLGLDDNDYDHLRIISLRCVPQTSRQLWIEQECERLRPDVLILDGIRDLVLDINNPSEAAITVSWLLHITSEYQVATLTVIHTNKSKSDHSMRGHLGTELLNKAFSVFETVASGTYPNTVYSVMQRECRGIPAENISFTINDEGLPESDLSDDGKTAAEAAKRAGAGSVAGIFKDESDDLCLKYGELRDRLVEAHGITTSAAEARIRRAKQHGEIKYSDGVYHL